MFIDENNLLYSFGRPEYGQLGHNTDGQYFVTANKLAFDCEVLPRHVAVFVEKTRDGLTHVLDDVKIVDVSCGNNHTVRFFSFHTVDSVSYTSFTRIRIFLKMMIFFPLKRRVHAYHIWIVYSRPHENATGNDRKTVATLTENAPYDVWYHRIGKPPFSSVLTKISEHLLGIVPAKK